MPHPFQNNVALDRHNTLGLPGCARRFTEITSAGQLTRIVRNGDLNGERTVILGGGSNVIVSGDIDATVLRICIPGREHTSADDDWNYVRVGAGEDWHDFVRWTLNMGWPGLENLSLIPGTAGAAPVQNIGAYGLEICDRFQMLEAVDLKSGQMVSFDREACGFSYRNSVFKQEGAGRFVITSVTVRLPKRWSPLTGYGDLARELEAADIADPTPMQVSDAIVAIRGRKLPDPAEIGNAGSFFKNPIVSAEKFAALSAAFPQMPHYPQADGRVKLAAGWLIEQADWKGKSLGPVGMYDHQALVMVNLGGATGQDVLRLSAAVRRDVGDRFGVILEMEPVLI